MTGSPLAAGTELAGYRIESLVGRGGMGVVYRARDLALDRNVALKLLAPELAGDVGFRERFLRESRLAASLDHPGVIPVYDAGEVAGQLYIAMRLVEGTDLKRMLALDGALASDRALALLAQVADALDAAHERGLVHRDVKPSNVLVDERGHCYLADFGLSRRLGEQTIGTGTARSLGTVDYAAPEQIRGEELDGRADVYSLGCLLYECLAGRPPYVRGSDTAVVFAHLEDEPPELPGLGPVLRKVLAKDPAERYASGGELIAAAREALRPPRRRRRVVAGLALLAAVGGTAGGLVATHGTGAPAGQAPSRPTLALQGNALNLVDARTRRVVARIPRLHGSVSDFAFLGRSAWLSIPDEKRLLRVDVASRTVTKIVRLPWMPTDRVAVGGGMVWVREARELGMDVLGIDATSGRIARRFPIGGSSIGVTYGAGSLWLIGGGDVVRVDPKSGKTLHHYPANADLLAFGDGAVWVAGTSGDVWKIDPVGNAVTVHAKLHAYLSDLEVGGGSVWVSILGEDKLYELGESDLAVEQAVPAGPDPIRIAAGDGTVWVANKLASAVSRVTDTGRRAQFAAGSEPTALRIHDGLVWVSATSALPRLLPGAGEELRISMPNRAFNTDPISRVFPMDETLNGATCANLLEYGPRGLRPEVAAAMPTVSPDGRTFTFQVRPGFRFSPPSNEPVTAETFRYTIERTLSPYSDDYPSWAPHIVGLEAYRRAVTAGRHAHISGITARGMTLSITLSKPAGDLPARLTIPLYCPVPLSTPLNRTRVQGPVPSDGPYYLASAHGDRYVLLRNPNYGGDRPRRTTRIVLTDDVPTPEAVALVDRGLLDYLPSDFSPARTLFGPQGELARLYGPGSAAARAGRQRLYLHTQPMFDVVVFNTQRPLFRSLRMRQAVEYAVDRPAMAHAFWDRASSERIVQLPGFGRGDVYPLSGPGLRTARRLAGPVRRRAVLLIPGDLGPSAAAGVLRSNLARIGIAVRIVHIGGSDQPTVLAAFRNADMIIGTSLQCGACERDPAEFVERALEHGLWGSRLPPGPWSAAPFRAELARAAPLVGRVRLEAYRRLDDELARLAPVVVYGSFLYPEYFGARVGCKRFPPFQQGVDLGALCVKKG
jgi:Protein kinase domain/Bacterial extracellular solute-binding proteins, family 5 Middle